MSNYKFPKKILALKNKDKTFMETWTDGRDALNIPHSYRMLCFGPPNSGKSLLVKNIVIRAKPMFDNIFLLHCDPDTEEYNDIEAVILASVPSPSEWRELTDKRKSLLIIDDFDVKSLKGEQLSNFDRTMGYVSSHCGLSVICCSQDAFNVPACVRRNSNIFALWRQPDLASLSKLASRTGFLATDFRNLFRHVKSNHDFVMIDNTEGSPYPIRLNGYETLQIK
jgi:hypothetical protein